ncbi:sulfatase family protein [Tundrisphaera sp. TA3]|uniref:sulfatase family protein n=1 Tax=Tundrisphaera sp. TA3 TaxID=3435775 RepID=UPI003EB97138
MGQGTVDRAKLRSRCRIAAWCVLCVLAMVVRPDGWPSRARAHLPEGTPPRGPNILILMGDDHAGGTLGIDGDPRRATPRLDALARQGVRFDRAYCNSPLCTPSRQSLITGRMPHAVGVTRLTTPMPDDALTLGDWLGDLGYRTAAFGKMHFNSPAHHGFQEMADTDDWFRWLRANPPAGGDHHRKWRPFQVPAAEWMNAACKPYGLPLASMEATYYVNRAVEFLRRDDDEPFALVVSFYEPHAPFKFPDEWAGRFKPEQFTVPQASEADLREQPEVFASLTPDQARGIQAAYYTAVSHMDYQVGRVLDALEASGHADDTIVIYLGDNGYMLGQHGRFEKHCFYEPSVRVPLLARWPGRLPADRRVTDLVELIDVVPTLLDLAGLPAPPDLHGRSLKGLAAGTPGAKGRDVVVSEYQENEEAMARSSRYKLVVGTGARQREDGYETGRPLPGPYERLYDLEADPGEDVDLLPTRPDLAAVAADLRHQLFLRLSTTREGRTPVPAALSEIDAIRWCLVPQD